MFIKKAAGGKRFIELSFEINMKLDKEAAASNIRQLRKDYSEDFRNQIVGSLLPVAILAASRYANTFIHKGQDLVSVGFHELTKAVTALALLEAEHEAPVDYIFVRISGKMARFIERDRVIAVPYGSDFTKRPVVVALSDNIPARHRKLLDSTADIIRAAKLEPNEWAAVVALRCRPPGDIDYEQLALDCNWSLPTFRKYRNAALAKIKKVLY